MQATEEIDHAQEPTIAEQIETVQVENADQPMDAESDAVNEQLALLQAIPELMEKVNLYRACFQCKLTRVDSYAFPTTLISLLSSPGCMKLTYNSFKHFAKSIWLRSSKPRVRGCTRFTRSPKVLLYKNRLIKRGC